MLDNAERKKRQTAKNGLPEKILLDGEKIRPAFSETVDRILCSVEKAGARKKTHRRSCGL